MARAEDEVEILNPPHAIAAKVEQGGPNAITEDLLERTDKNIIANFGAQYLDWLQSDIHELNQTLQAMDGGVDIASPDVVTFRACVHELRGMGGTFNFNLVSAIGDQMYRLISNCERVDQDRVEALGVHVDTLKVVLAEKLDGDGGERGRQVLAGLQKVLEKFS